MLAETPTTPPSIDLSAPSASSARNLSSAQLRARLKEAGLERSKRAILNWAGEGCPCDRRLNHGVEAPYFNYDEVIAWLKGKARRIGPEGQRDKGTEGQRPEEGADTIFTLAAEKLALLCVGKPDLDRRIAYTRLKLEEIMSVKPNTEAAHNSMAMAYQKVGAELRQLEAEQREERIRQRELVERVPAGRVITEFAQFVVTVLETLVADSGQAFAEALAEFGMSEEDAERMLRLLSTKQRGLVDAARTRVSDSIESRVAALGR